MLKAIGASVLFPELLSGSKVWGQAASSGPRGLGLCIGVNSVRPGAYGSSWLAQLDGAVNDAKAYKSILTSTNGNRIQVAELYDAKATRHEVTRYILWAARILRDGDLFCITYSGHGGQVRDVSGDEAPNEYDSTLCLYDGHLVDDELYWMWGYFDRGVRILFVSDSCNSGTVAKGNQIRSNIHADLAHEQSQIKALFREQPAALKVLTETAKSLKPRGSLRSVREVGKTLPGIRVRAMPIEFRQEAHDAQATLYDVEIPKRIGATADKNSAPQDDVAASVLLLAACPDGEPSIELGDHGAFTKAVLDVYPHARNYQELMDEVTKKVVRYQVPKITSYGEPNDSFRSQQKPFAIA